MNNQNDHLLYVKDLSVQFKSEDGLMLAVNKMSFTLNKGEKLGIVGESGSGKSVTSLSIMGLVPNPPGEIVNGEILFKDKDLAKASESEIRKIRGNKISMIFQEPMTSLNPILTCGFQIAESLILHKNMKKKLALKAAAGLLKSVGIPDEEANAKRYPHQLSGGMRQRVMIAMALACEPEILIADEPTTALDVTIQAQILDLMNKLCDDHDTAIIMITHDLGVVSEICDKVIVMYTGHAVEQADVKSIFKNPLHPYTKGLIDSIPRITKEKRRLVEIEGMVPNPFDKKVGCSFYPRCKYSMEKCKTQEPDIFEVGEEHTVRCWLFENGIEGDIYGK
jgi:oligopeptide/dipeptide ABC transporter ATP-binding protein